MLQDATESPTFPKRPRPFFADRDDREAWRSGYAIKTALILHHHDRLRQRRAGRRPFVEQEFQISADARPLRAQSSTIDDETNTHERNHSLRGAIGILRGQSIFVDLPSFHNELDMFKHLDIGKRIVLDRDDIGIFSRRDRTDVLGAIEQVGRVRRRGSNRAGGVSPNFTM